MVDLVEVTTTLPNRETALEMARHLVSGKHAACVQIHGPMTSVYSWKGQMHEEEEWKLVCKTLRSRVSRTMSQIQGMHPYETPEIIVLPILSVSSGYEQWVQDWVAERTGDSKCS